MWSEKWNEKELLRQCTLDNNVQLSWEMEMLENYCAISASSSTFQPFSPKAVYFIALKFRNTLLCVENETLTIASCCPSQCFLLATGAPQGWPKTSCQKRQCAKCPPLPGAVLHPLSLWHYSLLLFFPPHVYFVLLLLFLVQGQISKGQKEEGNDLFLPAVCLRRQHHLDSENGLAFGLLSHQLRKGPVNTMVTMHLRV